MSGTFERGSLAFAESVPVEELAVGDVITYLPPPDSGISELVTHRIIEIEATDDGSVFRTQGDANESVDPWLFQLDDPTQARVEATVPGLGWVFIALADREMRMLIIGAPAAVIGLLSLVDLIRAMRRPGSASEISSGSLVASAG